MSGSRARRRAVIASIRVLLLAPEIARAQKSGAALSATERALVKSADAHNASALALLIELVNINSGTMNFAGVRKVADVLAARLDSLGFKTRWVDGAPFHRAGHLVAEHPGSGPKLLLIRTSRHRVRARQSVSEIPADRRLDRARVRV